MNRTKKEELKRGEPFPSGPLTEEEYRELVNAKKEGREPNLEKAKEEKKSKLPK
jgi:hypothetical protein